MVKWARYGIRVPVVAAAVIIGFAVVVVLAGREIAVGDVGGVSVAGAAGLRLRSMLVRLTMAARSPAPCDLTRWSIFIV
jgi:hypothetical protein